MLFVVCGHSSVLNGLFFFMVLTATLVSLTDHDVDSHRKACPAVAWRRRSPRSIWRRRWPGPHWTILQTRRLFSEQPASSPTHNPQGQGQTSWGLPLCYARGCLLCLWRTWYVTNSRALFKHATQFLQQPDWLGYVIPILPVLPVPNKPYGFCGR